MTNGDISYTVKELLGQLGEKIDGQDLKLDRIVEALNAKADLTRLLDSEKAIAKIQLAINGMERDALIYIPEFEELKADTAKHLAQPHSVASHQEDRIQSLERWRAAIPATIFVAAAALIEGVVRLFLAH